jgi:hypothetical protein
MSAIALQSAPMTLYALVASDSDYAIDVFPTLALAEQTLADVLFDEPGFASLLSIIAIPPRFDIHDDTAAPYVASL